MGVSQTSCGVHRGVCNAMASSVSHEKFFCPSNRGKSVVGCGTAVQVGVQRRFWNERAAFPCRARRYGKQTGSVLDSHIW